MIREGQERAFEALVDRYQARLLAFCRGMLASAEDAEDVLQEVFVAAHKAILADNRAINARPWLYRIARNRCLNHLRKPVRRARTRWTSTRTRTAPRSPRRSRSAPSSGRSSWTSRDFPETQRSALLLREIDALAYEEIAIAMDTTVPAVKSLLVRARMSLADASQGRHLTCDEVHLELAEAAEGLRKVSGPARFHMRDCERCRDYRSELRRNGKALAALVPIGPLAGARAHAVVQARNRGSEAGAGAGSAGAGAGVGGRGGAGGAGIGRQRWRRRSGRRRRRSALAGSEPQAVGGALGAKAAAGMASMALLTAGAVEVQNYRFERPRRSGPRHRARTIAMAARRRGRMHGRRTGTLTAPPARPRASRPESPPSRRPPSPGRTERPRAASPEPRVPAPVAGGAETADGPRRRAPSPTIPRRRTPPVAPRGTAGPSDPPA